MAVNRSRNKFSQRKISPSESCDLQSQTKTKVRKRDGGVRRQIMRVSRPGDNEPAAEGGIQEPEQELLKERKVIIKVKV